MTFPCHTGDRKRKGLSPMGWLLHPHNHQIDFSNQADCWLGLPIRRYNMRKYDISLHKLRLFSLIAWLISLVYIVLISIILDRAALEWRVNFLPQSTAIAVRCDLIQRFLAVPIFGFFLGVFVMTSFPHAYSRFSWHFQLLFVIAGITMVLVGVGYCYCGLSLDIPTGKIPYLLWKNPWFAILWWILSGGCLSSVLFVLKAKG